MAKRHCNPSAAGPPRRREALRVWWERGWGCLAHIRVAGGRLLAAMDRRWTEPPRRALSRFDVGPYRAPPLEAESRLATYLHSTDGTERPRDRTLALL